MRYEVLICSLVAASFACLAIWCGVVAIRRLREPWRSACTRCSYDLSSVRDDELCPECGARVRRAHPLTRRRLVPLVLSIVLAGMAATSGYLGYRVAQDGLAAAVPRSSVVSYLDRKSDDENWALVDAASTRLRAGAVNRFDRIVLARNARDSIHQVMDASSRTETVELWRTTRWVTYVADHLGSEIDLLHEPVRMLLAHEDAFIRTEALQLAHDLDLRGANLNRRVVGLLADPDEVIRTMSCRFLAKRRVSIPTEAVVALFESESELVQSAAIDLAASNKQLYRALRARLIELCGVEHDLFVRLAAYRAISQEYGRNDLVDGVLNAALDDSDQRIALAVFDTLAKEGWTEQLELHAKQSAWSSVRLRALSHTLADRTKGTLPGE